MQPRWVLRKCKLMVLILQYYLKTVILIMNQEFYREDYRTKFLHMLDVCGITEMILIRTWLLVFLVNLHILIPVIMRCVHSGLFGLKVGFHTRFLMRRSFGACP